MAAQFTIRGNCKARPEAVYDLIASLQSHLEWNGERRTQDFRLLSLSAAPGPAGVGSTFESTGNIPMTSRRFHDRSTVTAAERPRLFEFRTESTVPFQNGDHTEAVFLHRYEVESRGEGSRVTYTMRQLSLRNGMWRLSWPVMHTFMWKVGIPMATKSGFRALLQMAAERQPSASVQPA